MRRRRGRDMADVFELVVLASSIALVVLVVVLAHWPAWRGR